MMTHSTKAKPLWQVVLAAGCIVGLAMGLRQTMGLYLRPMTMDLGIGREPFSNAMGIANLIWGVCAVGAGAASDKFGAGKVAAVGAMATIASLVMMASAKNEADLLIAGVMIGVGVSGTGITALVGAVGRAAPPEKRMAAIASLGMASGIGSFIAFPYTHVLIEVFGWKNSLLAIAITCVTLLPLAFMVGGKAQQQTGPVRTQSLSDAFREAFGHPSFWLLVAGFFVCGFHVSFYSVHLPAYVQDQGLDAWVGVWALTLLGVANIIGTWIAGKSGQLVEKRVGLSLIYFIRAALFVAIVYVPPTPVTVIVITFLLGLVWLSTIPLTSGLVATFFGTGWMSMLFGFVFLSHQLGSFVGLYMAGVLYDRMHSYTAMWWISAGLGLLAGLIHWPIKERPVARLAAA
jgi:MFS family permease